MNLRMPVFVLVFVSFFPLANAGESPQLSPETRQSIDKFSRDLEQQARIFSGQARELAELLGRDAEVINEQASDWVFTFGEQILRETEKLLEKSLEKLPEQRPKEQHKTPRQIAI